MLVLYVSLMHNKSNPLLPSRDILGDWMFVGALEKWAQKLSSYVLQCFGFTPNNELIGEPTYLPGRSLCNS